MKRFSAPGSSDDFARRPDRQDNFERGWDAVVTAWVDDAAEDVAAGGGNFFNPHRDETSGEPVAQPVAWDAFPRFLEKWFEDEDDADRKRWRTAEMLRPNVFGGKHLRRIRDGQVAEPVPTLHRQQDEYCEWFVHRDAEGAITRVTFTSEGPEYWRFLAGGTRALLPDGHPSFGVVDGDIELVAELYREHVDQSVTAEDLAWPYDVASWYGGDAANPAGWYLHRRAGDYNEFNRWNTIHGAMHLTHPANTLGAEINLAARATVLREDQSGNPIEDTEALICCSGYGEPNRSSDPSIGSGVNGFARDGLSVALADPVGLYIAGINLGALSGPNGEDVSGAWRVDRGSGEKRMILRATFAAPGLGLRVGELRARGEPIAFGGQVADEIQMTLTGLAKNRGAQLPSRQRCRLKCCESPERPGIETIVGMDEDCATVDWQELAPYLGDVDIDVDLDIAAAEETAPLVSERPPPVSATRAAR